MVDENEPLTKEKRRQRKKQLEQALRRRRNVPGTVYRMDEIPIPPRPAFESPHPSDLEILTGIECRVRELKRSDFTSASPMHPTPRGIFVAEFLGIRMILEHSEVSRLRR